MIIGIISGVIPTASATEKRKDSSSGRWKMMFTSRTKRTSNHGHPCEHHSEAAYAAAELRLRGRIARRFAISPQAVSFPVQTMTAVPIPFELRAEENAVACVGDAVLLLGKVSHRLLYRQGFSSEH